MTLRRPEGLEHASQSHRPRISLNQVEGIVHAPELDEDPMSTILEESEAQGVVNVTRFPSKTDRPNLLLKIRFDVATARRRPVPGQVIEVRSPRSQLKLKHRHDDICIS